MRQWTHTLLAALLALFVATPAAATITWTNCSGGTSGNLVQVTKYEVLCIDWDDTDTGDTRHFIVGSKTALLCFDPDLATEGASTAKINFRYCPNGLLPAANPENECFALSTIPITGITGAPGIQDACVRVGPGLYYVEIETGGGSTEDSRVTIQGEGN
jgi:hypothetical protein